MTKKIFIAAAIILVGGGLWLTLQTKSGGGNARALIPAQGITHGHGLAVDPNNRENLYIATHHGLLVLKNEKDLFRVGQMQDDYMGFSAHPTDSDVFYSSGHPSSGGNFGFQRSDDGGFTWHKISDGLNGPVDFHAMTVSPVDPNVIYGWFQGDIQSTKNAGADWARHPTAFPVVHLSVDTSDANTVYASAPTGFFKSIDAGATWIKLIEGPTATSAVHPIDQSILSVSQVHGLAKSTDGGATWKSVPEPFTGETPLYISFYRADPKLVYLITEKNSIYKSTDAGMTWEKLAAGQTQ